MKTKNLFSFVIPYHDIYYYTFTNSAKYISSKKGGGIAIEIHVKQNCIFLRAALPNTKSITAYSKCMYNKLECPQSTSQNLIMYKQSYTFPNPGESNIQVVNSSWNKL